MLLSAKEHEVLDKVRHDMDLLCEVSTGTNDIRKILESPIDWDAESLDLRFTITEGGKNMPVQYHGAQPSGFKAGSSILVEGKYGSDGVFRASQLILKCPSKYEALE